VLAANMETALNAVWDAAPGPADRIAVVGAGVVGSLVAYLCGRIPGAEVTLVDINPARAELAQALGVGFARPETAKRDCDLVVHASGNPAGLGMALALAGEEATVLELTLVRRTRRWRPPLAAPSIPSARAGVRASCLLTGEREGHAKSGRIAAGGDDEVAVALCRFGPRKANTKGLR